MSNYDPNQGYDQNQGVQNPGVQNPYGGGNAPAGYDPNAGKSDKRTFGLWSLWLGIAGMIIPVVLPSLAALVLGIVSLVKEPKAKTLGIWGTVLGALGLIWSLIFLTVVIPLILILTFGAAVVEYGTYTSY